MRFLVSKTEPNAMDAGYLNNNKYWGTHYDALNGSSVHDNIIGYSLTGAWKAHKGAFDELEFGAGGRQRTKVIMDVTNNAQTNGSGQYGSLYQTQGCPVQCSPYSFASQGFNVVSLTSIPNFMQGMGGSYPMVLPELNVGQKIEGDAASGVVSGQFLAVKGNDIGGRPESIHGDTQTLAARRARNRDARELRESVRNVGIREASELSGTYGADHHR